MANIENLDELMKEALDKCNKELRLNGRKLSPADLEAVSGGKITYAVNYMLEYSGHWYKLMGKSKEDVVDLVLTNWPPDYGMPPTTEELEEWLDNNWDNL